MHESRSLTKDRILTGLKHYVSDGSVARMGREWTPPVIIAAGILVAAVVHHGQLCWDCCKLIFLSNMYL